MPSVAIWRWNSAADWVACGPVVIPYCDDRATKASRFSIAPDCTSAPPASTPKIFIAVADLDAASGRRFKPSKTSGSTSDAGRRPPVAASLTSIPIRSNAAAARPPPLATSSITLGSWLSCFSRLPNWTPDPSAASLSPATCSIVRPVRVAVSVSWLFKSAMRWPNATMAAPAPAIEAPTARAPLPTSDQDVFVACAAFFAARSARLYPVSSSRTILAASVFVTPGMLPISRFKSPMSALKLSDTVSRAAIGHPFASCSRSSPISSTIVFVRFLPGLATSVLHAWRRRPTVRRAS